jgi:Ser/Thr protein kinase RdoA (MazF antagonist)
MTSESEVAPYRSLGPDDILDAVEACGLRCDGRLLALNSYENRVYQVGTEGGAAVVVKFYRPGRWSDEAILEEHRFTEELEAHEIPVIPPLPDGQGRTLRRHGPFRFAIYPSRGGRAPELDSPEHLRQLGRFVARIHNVGAVKAFVHRPTLEVRHFAVDSQQYLLAQRIIPADLVEVYRSVAEDLVSRIERCYALAGPVRYLRLHGDCHPGNILWTDQGPHIVDFDDARMGPSVQDLWMFLSGDRPYMTARLAELLDGYQQFRPFDPRELHLIEALRTMRMMHYAAWIARRWDDPAFPLAFPWFGSNRYWEDHILMLREQAALMDEAPLEWS